MIKTFRGLLGDGAQERIRLETIDGKTGYRVKKFELIGRTPGSMTIESVVKIYSIKQTTIDGMVDFSEQTLLAAGYWSDNSNVVYPSYETIVFDNITFNQDIFVTAFDASAGEFINYYLELETISLDDLEATAVILKNFRNTNTVV